MLTKITHTQLLTQAPSHDATSEESRLMHTVLVVAVCLNIFGFVFATVSSIYEAVPGLFAAVEYSTLAFFTCEARRDSAEDFLSIERPAFRSCCLDFHFCVLLCRSHDP